MRINKYSGTLILSCLALHSAFAQNADLNGKYPVTESWSVTIAEDNGETPTFSKTYHGTASGTLAINNGNFTLINKTGLPATAINALDNSRTISDNSYYGGAGYEIDGSYPVVGFAGNKALVQLTFFVVAVTLPVKNFAIPVLSGGGNDTYTATGDSLNSFSGAGDETDDNTGFTASASSTSGLGTSATGGKAPTVLTFSETWADKVACTGSSRQGDISCATYSGGKFTVAAVITTNDFGAAIDPSQFTGDTTFDITVGNYSFSGTLGDAHGYVAGATKAKFQVTGNLCSAKDNAAGLPCPTKVYETITLSWNTKAVTISISAATGADANGNTFETAIAADNFDGNDSGPVANTIQFAMDLGDLSVSSTILPVAGKVVTKTINDKSGNQDALSNVNIKGTLPATDLGQ